MSSRFEKLEKHSGYYRHLKSDIIYFRKSIRGKLVEFSTGETGINKAKLYVEEKLSEKRITKKKGIAELKPNALIETMWDLFMEEKRNQGLSDQTLSVNGIQWRIVLSEFFKDKSVTDLNTKTFKLFESWYLKKHPERIYFNTKKTLKNLISFIQSQDYEIEDYDFRDLDLVIKSNKKHERVGRVYTQREVDRLLEFAKPSTRMGVLLSFYTGMRKTEFLSLKLSSIEKDKIKVWSFKNKKWRTIPMPKPLAGELAEYIKTYGGKVYLFESKNNKGELIPQHSQVFDKGWVEAKKKARISRGSESLRARIHDLRHTCATNMAQSGMPTAVACSILDMSLTIFEKTYVHVTEKSKKEWMDKLHG